MKMKWIINLLVASATIAVLCTSAMAQKPEDPGPLLAGYRSITFTNASYPGSPSIPCLVAYPGQTAGQNAVMDRSAAPYPVIVFGHGFLVTGSSFRVLAQHYASWGFIFVAPDTFQFGPMTSEKRDMEALTRIVRDEHVRNGSFLFGAVDVNNVAVAGHSMGGGAAAGVLGSTSNVKVGVLLAPWVGTGPDASDWMKTARVPFQILVGDGDFVAPPSSNALKFYQKGAVVSGYRGMTRLWPGCDHSAVGKPGSSQNSMDAFRLSRRQQTAFMLAHLKGRDDMLDVLVGVATHAEPKFTSVAYVAIDPDLYITGSPKVGGTLDYHVMARANTTAYTYFSPAPANLPLPGLGTLGLNPTLMVRLSTRQTTAQQTAHASFPIPNVPGLAGLRIWLQAAAVDAANTYRLTPTRDFRLATGP